MRPEDVPAEIADLAYDAYLLAPGDDNGSPNYYVRAAIAAVWPLIAQAERERCAKVAEDIWASYRTDADRADGAGDAELSMLALRSTTVARQITSNIRALPDTGE